MLCNLTKYKQIVDPGEIEQIYEMAEKLKGISLVHINSTAKGGGVAEILKSLVPLFNCLGINCRWEVIKGTEEFFFTTKLFHNLLQGITPEGKKLSQKMLNEYRKINKENAKRIDFTSDVVIIHDPQPAALIEAKKNNKWVWRCHIDLSSPDKEVWNFLSSYIKKYDAAIFSMQDFVQPLSIPRYIIPPSIDPFSQKNKELSHHQIRSLLENLNISQDKPLVVQISRFDYFKDPSGVIKTYRRVRKKVNCQLILAGGGATDDPEHSKIFNELKKEIKNDPDIHILNLPPQSHLEINALQRSAQVVIQKSLKEGFGLTVTEALWKARPVVGGNAGGIKLQLKNGENGFLVSSVEEAAEKVEYLLKNPHIADKMGKKGKKIVREKFLITRHIKDYLKMINQLISK